MNIDNKKFVLRDVKSGMYLSIFDGFVEEYRAYECIIRVERCEESVYLVHDATDKVLLTNNIWDSKDAGNIEQFKMKYHEQLFGTGLFRTSTYNSEQEDEQQPIYMLEENTDKPVDIKMLGDFSALSKDAISEIKAMQEGGKPLEVSLDTDKKSEEIMANLINYIGSSEKEVPIWRSGHLKDGSHVQFCYLGDAIITVAIPNEIDKQTKDFIRTVADGEEPDWSTQGLGVITYKTPQKTNFSSFLFSKEGAAFIGQLAFSKIVSSMISSGLAYVCRTVAKRLVMKKITQAMARGLQSSMSQTGWYVRLVSYMGSGATGAAFIGGAINLGIFILVQYLLSKYLFPYIWKKQYLALQVFNISKIPLGLSISKLSNVPENSQDNPDGTYYTLPPYLSDPIDPFLAALGITPDDTVVYNYMLKFENDSTFMEGFSVLLSLKSTKEEVVSCFDIPYNTSNSNISKVRKNDESYSSLLNTLEAKNKNLNYTLDLDNKNEKVISSISGLLGNNNYYKGQIVFKDGSLNS